MQLFARRVLCLDAHCDDWEPQAGGTVLKLVEAGAIVRVVTAIAPNLDRFGQQIEGAQDLRLREAHEAALILRVHSHEVLGLDPEQFAYSQPFVQLYDRIALEFRPDLIISHGPEDTQQDHATLANIAHTLCRKNRIALWQIDHSLPGGFRADRPRPNLIVDVTAQHERKLEAVVRYKSQVERYPGWLEGIEARSRYYGWMVNQEGSSNTVHAEGFRTPLMLWD